MHVRLYCDPGDRRLGCADRGPVRWWKKMWKYMEAALRPPAADALGGDGVAALGAAHSRASCRLSSRGRAKLTQLARAP